jgi:hypothetical protein
MRLAYYVTDFPHMGSRRMCFLPLRRFGLSRMRGGPSAPFPARRTLVLAQPAGGGKKKNIQREGKLSSRRRSTMPVGFSTARLTSWTGKNKLRVRTVREAPCARRENPHLMGAKGSTKPGQSDLGNPLWSLVPSWALQAVGFLGDLPTDGRSSRSITC